MSGRAPSRIASAATLVFALYAVSRVLGYLRDVVIAARFGTTREIDTYYLAFNLPDLLLNLILVGAVSSAFIPVLSEYLGTGQNQRAVRTAATVINAGLLLLTTASLLAFLLAPYLVRGVIARGFSPADQETTITLTRIMLLQPIFLGTGGCVLGVLIAHQRFLAQSLAPIAYNIAIIGAAVLFAPRYGVYALAVGVVLGGLFHLLIQLPALWSTGWRPGLMLDLKDPGVQRIGRLMLPIALGMTATQVNVFVDRALGSGLPGGRITAFTYANNLTQVPLGTFSQALALVIFPYLARDAAAGNLESLRRRAALALRLNVFVLVPAGVGLIALGLPIMTLLFQRGHFTQDSARQTYAALVFFAVALWAQAGTALLVRVLFALQDVITPLKIALVVILANVAFSVVLVRPLEQGGLALATSLAAALNMGLLVMTLRQRLSGLELGQLARSFLQASAGAAILALVGAGSYRLLAGTGAGVGLAQLLAVVVALAVAGGAYALFELMIGSREARVLLSLLRRDRAPLGV
jgi:putative peptidoglycan lipid II flippase